MHESGSSEDLEKAIETFERETGYKAEYFSPIKPYKSGAILRNKKIVEIGMDDHSILRSLPNRLTYRFVDGELYYRVPADATDNQLELAIRIAPTRFNLIAVDVIENEKVIKSLEKTFVVGAKPDLRKFLEKSLAPERTGLLRERPLRRLL